MAVCRRRDKCLKIRAICRFTMFESNIEENLIVPGTQWLFPRRIYDAPVKCARYYLRICI